MKRNEEVTIVVEALIRNRMIDPQKTDEARAAVKGALKEIRFRKYEENKRKKAPKMKRASKKPVSIPLLLNGDVDLIVDKVLDKFLERMSEEIRKPVTANPFDYSATDDSV